MNETRKPIFESRCSECGKILEYGKDGIFSCRECYQKTVSKIKEEQENKNDGR